jgi:hypothetical protein
MSATLATVFKSVMLAPNGHALLSGQRRTWRFKKMFNSAHLLSTWGACDLSAPASKRPMGKAMGTQPYPTFVGLMLRYLSLCFFYG